jgi:hypothetical protein
MQEKAEFFTLTEDLNCRVILFADSITSVQDG